MAPRQPCFTVHSAQTRLPLSTAETNRGLHASDLMIANALQDFGPENWLADGSQAALLHGPQRANQIAIVHRRNESRLARLRSDDRERPAGFRAGKLAR